MQYSVWLVILLLAMSLTLHQNIAETIPCPTIVPTTNIDTTADSSIYPTVNSSIYPTVNSSIYPTVNSSIYPTANPAVNPSIDQTDLTASPTVMPSCTSGEPSTASSPSVETSHSPTTFSSVTFYITQVR